MTSTPAHSDKSDDQIMQDLAMAAALFKARFGVEELAHCLRDLLKTIDPEGLT